MIILRRRTIMPQDWRGGGKSWILMSEISGSYRRKEESEGDGRTETS
jgi:hypothetical protein